MSSMTAEQLISVASELFKKVASNGAKKRGSLSLYDSEQAPGIAVGDYMKRLVRYTGCEVDTIIIAVIYVDRICVNGNITITANNVHRLLLAAFVVAIKWRQDRVHGNSHYATVGGVTLKELGRLERTALNDMRWETHVEPSLYAKYAKQLAANI